MCPVPQFKKLTPNLLVVSVERSLAFYEDLLGFSRGEFDRAALSRHKGHEGTPNGFPFVSSVSFVFDRRL